MTENAAKYTCPNNKMISGQELETALKYAIKYFTTDEIDRALEDLQYLVDLCLQHQFTSSSDMIASVLLHFFNHSNKCRLSFSCLDDKNRTKLLNVINFLGWFNGGYHEPHKWFKDDSKFRKMVELYYEEDGS